MGLTHSTRKEASFNADGEVNFDHFQILRAIGKGSFGKVCIVRKKDSKKMYAMKYMNKRKCIEKNAVRHVMQEMRILLCLSHPFLVNLWFTFQDEEDMFMLVDLQMGGDLRYHIQQQVKFDNNIVKLYICELALALDYLRSKNIVHRDLKPDNILLDEEGHVHITDFNIAAFIKDTESVKSVSGTKPYMAPEVFACVLKNSTGYGFAVDWWSLGVSAYEMLRGKRPYNICANTGFSEVKHMFDSISIHYPSHWDPGMTDILRQLLHRDWRLRISSLDQLKKHWYCAREDFEKILNKEAIPSFVPSKDQLNCDPAYELEEMIIEANPLHKKKKRLAKQNSKRGEQSRVNSGTSVLNDPIQEMLDNINKEFPFYNREREGVAFRKVSGSIRDTEEMSTTRSKLMNSEVSLESGTSIETSVNEEQQSYSYLKQTKSVSVDLTGCNAVLPVILEMQQKSRRSSAPIFNKVSASKDKDMTLAAVMLSNCQIRSSLEDSTHLHDDCDITTSYSITKLGTVEDGTPSSLETECDQSRSREMSFGGKEEDCGDIRGLKAKTSMIGGGDTDVKELGICSEPLSDGTTCWQVDSTEPSQERTTVTEQRKINGEGEVGGELNEEGKVVEGRETIIRIELVEQEERGAERAVEEEEVVDEKEVGSVQREGSLEQKETVEEGEKLDVDVKEEEEDEADGMILKKEKENETEETVVLEKETEEVGKEVLDEESREGLDEGKRTEDEKEEEAGIVVAVEETAKHGEWKEEEAEKEVGGNDRDREEEEDEKRSNDIDRAEEKEEEEEEEVVVEKGSNDTFREGEAGEQK